MSTPNQNPARAVADLATGTILASVEIAAPPERVFRALTHSDEVVRWWGADEAYRTTEWSMDLKVGGAWRAGGRGADGHAFSVGGEIVALDPPRLLSMTWKPDWDAGHTTTIAYRLEPIEGGTRVTVRHEGFAGRPDACRGHTEGWEKVLGWLGGHLAPAAPERRFFFLRLHGPRPTFPADATAEELEIMRAHSAYWAEHLRAGTAIVFGPVNDPKGPWGLGVLRVPDEATLKALQAGDPAIRSGRGFRYETLPMMRAIVRD